MLDEAQLMAARRALSERTADGKRLSFADLARMVEEEFDRSGLGALLEEGEMRHIARIIVDYDVLRDALGLPEDATIWGVSDGERLFAVVVKVEHPECPAVEEGCVIPLVEPTFESVEDGKPTLTDWGFYVAK